MQITREVLETGVIITSVGEVKESSGKILEGDLFFRCSPEKIQSSFRIDEKKILLFKESIRIEKTLPQAVKETTLAVLYFGMLAIPTKYPLS